VRIDTRSMDESIIKVPGSVFDESVGFTDEWIIWSEQISDLRWQHSGRSLIRALRSEEHTSELQSRENLVCRLLLEKKNKRPKLQTRTKVTRTKREKTCNIKKKTSAATDTERLYYALLVNNNHRYSLPPNQKLRNVA